MRKTLSLSSALLLVALAGSAAFSCFHIASVTIWFDETITLLTVAGHALPDWNAETSQFSGAAGPLRILTDLYVIDVHPPLYFWVVAAWRTVAGFSLESIRALSALFMLASIWLLYRVAEGFGIKRPGVVAALYAFSSVGITYAFTARSYAMALFLIVLTLFLAQRKSAWTGVAAVASIATHYFAALCVGPILLYYIITEWKTDRRWALLTTAVFAAGIAVMVPLLLKHFGARPAQYIAPTSALAEVAAVARNVLSASFPSSVIGWLRKGSWIAVGLCAMVGAIQAQRKHHGVLWFSVAAFIAGFLAMAIVSHKSIISMPGAYYFGLAAPLLALLIALGLETIPPMLAVVTVLLVASWATPVIPVIPNAESANYRRIIATIRPQCGHCTLIAGAGSGRGVPGSVTYEAGSLPVLVLNGNLQEIVAKAAQYQRLYFFPANEGRGVADEQALIQRLGLVSTSGYFQSTP